MARIPYLEACVDRLGRLFEDNDLILRPSAICRNDDRQEYFAKAYGIVSTGATSEVALVPDSPEKGSVPSERLIVEVVGCADGHDDRVAAASRSGTPTVQIILTDEERATLGDECVVGKPLHRVR
jgi:hypothetical protein